MFDTVNFCARKRTGKDSLITWMKITKLNSIVY